MGSPTRFLCSVTIACLTIVGCGPNYQEQIERGLREAESKAARAKAVELRESLQTMQACFARAAPAVVSSTPVVVPQAGTTFAARTLHGPRGNTLALLASGSVVLYSAQGQQLGRVIVDQSGTMHVPDGVYSADGSKLLVWNGAGFGAVSAAAVVDIATATVVGRCEVKVPELGSTAIAPGAERGYVNGALTELRSQAVVPLAEAEPRAPAAFSPDGSKVLVAIQSGFAAFDVTGKRLGSLAVAKVKADDTRQPLAISNDGRTWAYRNRDATGCELVVSRVGQAKPLHRARSGLAPCLMNNTSLAPGGAELVSSVDAVALRASAAGRPTHSTSNFGMGVMASVDLATGKARALTSTADLFVHPTPDGRRLAFGTPELGPLWSLPTDLSQPPRRERDLRLHPWASKLPDRVYSSESVVAANGGDAGHLVARTMSTGAEQWRFARAAMAYFVAELGDVVIVDALEVGGRSFVFLDASNGAERARIPGDAAVVWDDAHVLVATKHETKHCVRLVSVADARAGDVACTSEFARPDPALHQWDFLSLVKAPKKLEAALLRNDGSVHIFDGKQLRKAVAAFRDPSGAVRGEFSRKKPNELVTLVANELHTLDLANGKHASILKDPDVHMFALAGDERRIFVGGTRGLEVVDRASAKRLASLFFFTDGEWVVLGEDGVFAASERGGQYLAVRVGKEVHRLEQYGEKLYRPDLLMARLTVTGEAAPEPQPEPKVDLKGLVAVGLPPRLEWLGPAGGKLSTRDITVRARIHAQSGGLGRIEWRLNGTVIGGANQQRGLKVQREGVDVSKLVTLAPGDNRVEIVAYTERGDVASMPVAANYVLIDAISERPNLYVLAVGINQYRDVALRLKYAVPDAHALVQSLRSVSGKVFGNVTAVSLTDEQVTRDGLQAAFAQAATAVRSQDVFVLYVAGHGITFDGRYHFVPVDFRYRNEASVAEQGVTQDHLRDWLAQIPALKSLVLLDTCNSGSFVQAQVATRGMADKTAIDKLTRATGRATIAASSNTQVAIEGHEGHGVFTWALLQGMQRADRNRDGVLSTAELASYVDDTVPELTFRRWGYEQVPQVLLHGREFPIGVVR